MHLLQFSQSIDSPSEIYVAFQWDPLLRPSLPPRQEGHSDTRVLGQMPSDPLWCISAPKSQIHCHDRTISLELFEIPHTRPELPASPAIPLALFFFFFFFFLILSTTPSVNLWSKCWERKRIGEELGKMKRRGNRKKEGEKTQVENKTTQLVHLCHCKPVKSPCVFVRVRVNKTVFEVGLQHCTVASLRPLLSPCKNVQGDYRKCYRIQS